MTNRAAAVVLALGVAAALLFAFDPALDLAISARFYDPGRGFWGGRHAAMDLFRQVSMYIPVALGLWGLASLVTSLMGRAHPLLLRRNASLFLVVSVVVGPILTVNVGLKDNWQRPRPIQVQEFGGAAAFRPWYKPGGTCELNCSFVSGETSGAVWLAAPASLAPAPWRPLAYGAVAVFSVLVSLLRLAFGGHFASDILLSAALTLLIIWACRRIFLSPGRD